jgi:hypothetical protein
MKIEFYELNLIPRAAIRPGVYSAAKKRVEEKI